MPRRGKRKRLDRCIYQDSSGPSIIVGGREYSRGLHGLTLAQLRAKRNEIEQKRKGSGRVGAVTGTLAAAVDAWDGQEQHLASYVERRSELRAWVRELGDRPLGRIDAADIRRVVVKWTAAGLAPKTIRNRLWSLQHLYHLTLGPKADTPVDDIEPPAKVRTVIAPVTPELILSVYRKLLEFERPHRPTPGDGVLRDAKTRARFMVRASTGRRPSEIMRAQPEDVDLDRRIWRVRDGKGGWSEGLYLNDDMLIAWQTFADADAWGAFNTGSMAEVLRAAGWPSQKDARGRYVSRPYHLRHTLGMEISERGVDLADVGGWLGHTDLHTTRRVYAPVLNSRMERIGRSLDGRLSGWSSPSNSPRTPVAECGDSRISQGNREAPEASDDSAKPAGCADSLSK